VAKLMMVLTMARWRGLTVTSRTKLWSTFSASKERAAKASSEE
jgi:hypothetical protein